MNSGHRKVTKQNLTEGTPWKGLLFFALPMILGNLFQQFYNMADSIVVGNFVGENALAAVGASYAFTNVFIMIAIGGGSGSSVLTAQYLGAGQYQKMKTSISTALISFLILSIGFGTLGLFLNRPILIALDTPSNVLDQAALYLGIYFTGLPFMFMYNILASVFNSMGDSRTPLYLLIFSSLLNVGLDILSVTAMGMDVDGVAIATVFSQGVSVVISFLLLLKRLKQITPDSSEQEAFRLFDVNMLKNGTKIAIPTILQQSIVSIGMLLVQSVVNGFGSAALAGYSAASRIDSICIVPMIATGNAMATFTAQNIGAGDTDRVRRGYRASYGIIASFAVITAAALALFKEPMIAAFLGSADGEAYKVGTGYLGFLGWFFAAIGLKATTDAVLRGSGDVVVFTISNLVNLSLRVAMAFLLAPVLGVAAVWYAVPIGWSANYIISFCRYLTGKWQKKRLV